MSRPAEYVDVGYNPITGCDPAFPCWERCWARRFANRMAANLTIVEHARYADFRPAFWPERLAQPVAWRKPRRIAVAWMGDMWADGVLEVWRTAVKRIMVSAPRHKYLMLTKRPQRAMDSFGGGTFDNWWLGASVSTQADLDARMIPGIRWLSVEPMLGPVSLRNLSVLPEWIVCGGESGPGARPCDKAWVYDLAVECFKRGIPFWDKRNVLHGVPKQYPKGLEIG